METRSSKIHKATSLLLFSLLCSFAMAKQALPDCCRQRNCSCRILEMLHSAGNHAAGILTLGKRSDSMATKAFQNRLYHLLHGSGNQAAGILTMGKRATEPATEHMDGTPGNPLVLAFYAAGSNLAEDCRGPLDKDSTYCRKLSSAETEY